MKKIIVFLILITFFNCEAQIKQSEYSKSLRLTGKTNLTYEQQIEIAIESIIQFYGKSFKYYNELIHNKFRITHSENEYNIEIFDENSGYNTTDIKNNIIKIKLKQNIIDNQLVLTVDNNILKKYITNEINVDNKTIRNGDYLTIFQRNNILVDKYILENENIPGVYWKILNKTFANTYFTNQNGDPANLFDNLLSAVIIPYNSGSKILTIDAGFNSSIYFDSELSSEEGPINKFYGTYGPAIGQFFKPTDIIIGREHNLSNFISYPIYIADCNNFRIIKLNYNIDPLYPQSGDYDVTSVVPFTKSNFPFGLAYYQHLEDPNKDKIWASESNPIQPRLSCYNTEGIKSLSVNGYYYVETNQSYLFEEDTESRLAIYNDYFGALAFIDNKRNALVSCLLNNNGTSATIQIEGNELIIANDVKIFPLEYPLSSVSFYKTPLTMSSFPFMLVTSTSHFHLLRMNNSAHTHYLASSNVPFRTDENRPFTDLTNTIKLDNFYDIFTIEKWNNNFGLRKFWFNAGIHSASLIQGCKDSLLKFQATFTNDCWLYLQAYRKNRNGNWDIVKIKTFNGEPVNDYHKVRYQMAAWNRISNDLYINMDLDLPIEDLALGAEIKLTMYIFPEYEYPDPLNQNRIYDEYTMNITPSCLTKPGGCPFLYVLNNEGEMVPDNNLLHKYEYSWFGADITDKYKLQINPKIDNNLIKLYLLENENDIGYFDQVKLYAIDYPSNKNLCMTEDNEIVVFTPENVKSSDYATHGLVDITNNINYHHPSTPVNGAINDNIYAHFPVDLSIANNKSATDILKKNKNGEINLYRSYGVDKLGFISKLGNISPPVPHNKDKAGTIIATSTTNEVIVTDFSRREIVSLIAVPIFDFEYSIDNVSIEWSSDFCLKTAGIVNLEYTGFTMNEIPLTYASSVSILTENEITLDISQIDNVYGEVNPNKLIKMEFNTSLLPIVQAGYTRDYVIEASGHYTQATVKEKLLTQGIPQVFRLHQNYPNPFNPKTTIKFDIPKDIKVTIRVYDMLGKEVKTLVNEYKKAGFHEVDFEGSSLASGVYFYKIETGNFVVSKKMVLVK